MGRTTVKDELGRMRKEMVMAYFKTPFQYLPGETEEDHKNL
jgi:hypothetical protein